MKALLQRFMIVFKGFIIGSSMTVPGVSGGTMAILLGIYDKLISSISHFTKDIKGNAWYLIKFGIGSVVGIASLALLFDKVLFHYDFTAFPISFLFLGVVIGGIPALYKKAKPEKMTTATGIKMGLLMLVGFAVVIGIGFLPEGLLSPTTTFSLQNLIVWFITGVIVAIALILPGISTSHMLLVLGMLKTTYAAISNLEIGFLLILVISTLVGIFLITRPLEWVMNRFPVPTYCVIIGFVVGSLSAVFKEEIIPSFISLSSSAWWVWALLAVTSVVCFIVGVKGILYLSKFSEE